MKNFALSVATTLALSAALQAQQSPTLKVGSPAPKLSVFRLVKGQPFKAFEPGKVYVVEFWATWCGPCRESIPHLTSLAKKFKGKATFVGVDSFEEGQNSGNSKTTYLAGVRSFVKEMGAKMSYNVVADDPTGHLGKSWMEAAGQDGIPTAFVVDKQSKIAWIGHPMMGLDAVLPKVIKGTYKPTDAPAAAPAEATGQAMPPEEKALMDAIQAKDDHAIVSASDKMIEMHPNFEEQIAEIKVKSMATYDVPGALAYAKTVSEGAVKSNASSLNNIAWVFVDPEHPVTGGDPVFAEGLARKAIGLSERSDPLHAMAMDTLAAALYAEGKQAEAVAEEKLAIAEATSLGTKFPAASLKDLKQHLPMFQGAKQI